GREPEAGAHASDLTPLAALEALENLNLSATEVALLSPLEGLSKVVRLDISYTHVSDLAPLLAWPEPGRGCRTLTLTEEPLDESSIERVIPTLCARDWQVSGALRAFCSKPERNPL